MTEVEWLATTDPQPMLEFLKGKASDRKLRLLGCGSACRAVHLIEFDALNFIRLAEEAADNLADSETIARAIAILSEYESANRVEVIGFVAQQGQLEAACAVHVALDPAYQSNPWRAAVHNPLYVAEAVNWTEGTFEAEYAAHVRVVRCVAGNPFRTLSIEPSWLTSTVVALAEGIYQDRAFDRLPILADALQDSGCDNDDVLNHCRGDGPHVRGCWVVDLVLGKE